MSKDFTWRIGNGYPKRYQARKRLWRSIGGLIGWYGDLYEQGAIPQA